MIHHHGTHLVELHPLSFGSGFDMENRSPAVLEKAKRLSAYARSKGIEIGSYSLLASRGIGPADDVLAQPDMDANGENRWDAVADDSLCWPYGLCLAGNRLAIADSGNNRVMVWELA